MIPNGFSPEEPKKGDGLKRGDSQGLIDISLIKGWDPRRIEGFTDAEGGDISQFDKAASAYRTSGNDLGTLDNMVPQSGTEGGTGGPVLDQKITFAYPDLGREARVSGKPKMTLSDPEPGIVDY